MLFFKAMLFTNYFAQKDYFYHILQYPKTIFIKKRQKNFKIIAFHFLFCYN